MMEQQRPCHGHGSATPPATHIGYRLLNAARVDPHLRPTLGFALELGTAQIQATHTQRFPPLYNNVRALQSQGMNDASWSSEHQYGVDGMAAGAALGGLNHNPSQEYQSQTSLQNSGYGQELRIVSDGHLSAPIFSRPEAVKNRMSTGASGFSMSGRHPSTRGVQVQESVQAVSYRQTGVGHGTNTSSATGGRILNVGSSLSPTIQNQDSLYTYHGSSGGSTLLPTYPYWELPSVALQPSACVDVDEDHVDSVETSPLDRQVSNPSSSTYSISQFHNPQYSGPGSPDGPTLRSTSRYRAPSNVPNLATRPIGRHQRQRENSRPEDLTAHPGSSSCVYMHYTISRDTTRGSHHQCSPTLSKAPDRKCMSPNTSNVETSPLDRQWSAGVPDSNYISDSAPGSSSNESEAICPDCNRTYSGEYRKGNLARHRRQKHGKVEQSYPCEEPFCLQKFKRQDARLKHYRKHHPGRTLHPPLPRKSGFSS